MSQVVFYQAVILLLMLSFTTSEHTVQPNLIGSREPIRAALGGDVILPCHLEPPSDATALTVQWKFNGSFAHVYRSRGDDASLQDGKFKNRTSLFHDEMHKGNISLKLTNVTESHGGNYTCWVSTLQSQVKRGYLTLTVDSVEKGNKRKSADGPTDSTGLSPEGVAGVVIVCIVLVVALCVVGCALLNRQGRTPERRGPRSEGRQVHNERLALSGKGSADSVHNDVHNTNDDEDDIDDDEDDNDNGLDHTVEHDVDNHVDKDVENHVDNDNDIDNIDIDNTNT